MLPRQTRFQSSHGLIRRPCSYEAPTIRDAVDVDIHRDPGVSAHNAEREVCALRADSRKRRQYLEVAGQLASELLNGSDRNVVNGACFGLVEGGLGDERVQFLQ